MRCYLDEDLARPFLKMRIREIFHPRDWLFLKSSNVNVGCGEGGTAAPIIPPHVITDTQYVALPMLDFPSLIVSLP